MDGVKKRKKTSDSQTRQKKKIKTATTSNVDSLDRIDEFEAQILESQKYYNKINELIQLFKEPPTQKKAGLSLTKIFLIFLDGGEIILDLKPQDDIVHRWLLKQYQQFCDALLDLLPRDKLFSGLLFKVLQKETSVATSNQIWTEGLFRNIIQLILDHEEAVDLRNDVLTYRDARTYAARVIGNVQHKSLGSIDNAISMLNDIASYEKDTTYGTAPDETRDICLAKLTAQSKRKPPSVTAHKKAMEEGWLAILRSDLDPAQRKRLLEIMSDKIAPWFTKPEMLSDFLTDSFNAGGALSLTALSGIFYLIQHRNLDYPQFYTKVYSLIDQNILHSKQRSQFLRLMNIFLASTHLPAALVASFMKRLSRLCLHAPPAAIIAIVPWMYNMIKEHPVTTFMIHRKIKGESNEELQGEDPFDYNEPDPMKTRALESSLWEIQTLFDHYHPNVATIASIIGKPFTKQSYKFEDFLDYTYDGMLDADLGKALKKAPVVEFQIPKHIFSRVEDGETGENTLLTRIFDFSS